jgi:hypothetical protein
MEIKYCQAYVTVNFNYAVYYHVYLCSTYNSLLYCFLGNLLHCVWQKDCIFTIIMELSQLHCNLRLQSTDILIKYQNFLLHDCQYPWTNNQWICDVNQSHNSIRQHGCPQSFLKEGFVITRNMILENQLR